MKYLSLFSGVEGGGLAFQHLIEPKITCIGYVEYDDYCQRVIRQRQIDGLLDKAPIYGDIRTFIDSGCAELYRGITNVITAGFPCQPFSVAGKRKGGDDKRNMWPATIATLRLVRPKYALLENVPGLLTSGYMPRIFAELAEAGYDARWTVLGADDVGARHRRKRLWILAYSNSNGTKWDKPENGQGGRIEQDGSDVADSISIDPERNEIRRASGVSWWQREPLEALQDARQGRGQEAWLSIPESELGRVAHGVGNRVDRLKAIGNGQVPQVAALAWEILNE